VPDFHTIRNAIFHEYCFVKAESRSGRFPEVDPRAYMGAILEDFSQLEKQFSDANFAYNEKKLKDPRVFFVEGRNHDRDRARFSQGGAPPRRPR